MRSFGRAFAALRIMDDFIRMRRLFEQMMMANEKALRANERAVQILRSRRSVKLQRARNFEVLYNSPRLVRAVGSNFRRR
jgi:ABC-type siderophore export system fused ATPase/permease subunit